LRGRRARGEKDHVGVRRTRMGPGGKKLIERSTKIGCLPEKGKQGLKRGRSGQSNEGVPKVRTEVRLLQQKKRGYKSKQSHKTTVAKEPNSLGGGGGKIVTKRRQDHPWKNGGKRVSETMQWWGETTEFGEKHKVVTGPKRVVDMLSLNNEGRNNDEPGLPNLATKGFTKQH